MKKAISIISVVVVILACGVFSIFFFAPSSVSVSYDESAELTYVYDDKNIKTTLEDDERNELCAMFEGKKTYLISPFDMPSCGFNENVSVKIGNTVFMPACDKCGTVKTGFVYFNISKRERSSLERIFKKYGATFPCV